MSDKSDKEVFVFSNGNLAFCVDGEQVPAVQQKAWILLIAVWLETCGYDPTEVVFNMPNRMKARIIREDGGEYNWTLE